MAKPNTAPVPTQTKALDFYREMGVPPQLTFDAVVAQLHDQGDLEDSAEVFGSGWTVVKDKRQLIGKMFLILDWRFNAGDNGEFASLNLLTKEGERLILNDGSTGIYAQLKKADAAGKTGAYLIQNGLRVSDYEFTDEKGLTKKASTFYLDA